MSWSPSKTISISNSDVSAAPEPVYTFGNCAERGNLLRFVGMKIASGVSSSLLIANIMNAAVVTLAAWAILPGFTKSRVHVEQDTDDLTGVTQSVACRDYDPYFFHQNFFPLAPITVEAVR